MKKTGSLFFLLVFFIACLDKKHKEENNALKAVEKFCFKEVSELPIQPTLPPLLVDSLGDSIQSLTAWEARREYIKQMLIFYQYGQIPLNPPR